MSAVSLHPVLAPAGLDTEDEHARLVRTVGLLTRSPFATRMLDELVAQALGWQVKTEEGVQFWRRFGLAWRRQDSKSVPPRYTNSVEALLGELPANAVVTLYINQGSLQAQIIIDDRAVQGYGMRQELGLAAAIVGSRLFAVPEGSAA